jgi:hypothetical protein
MSPQDLGEKLPRNRRESFFKERSLTNGNMVLALIRPFFPVTSPLSRQQREQVEQRVRNLN